ncbi:L,D-transpeptidase [Silicimonas algicola]|uniref:Lipoprotein-anchoring transpeptidase ErfK/SrfK n=1 Tax=Silicimonas algicola TaxID=1826607 RepID=A0A316G0Z2_9RHOB|nr:L,D-transpeptidase [Silicimonas algicola]AZQ68244.1 L,D-transpeptidase [Silicimonas algicola]PWK54624.1 lipoprotein-anchoring transpeptidase ErfK/SrfK [Silicimonas algicola]
MTLTRRHFIATSATLFSAALPVPVFAQSDEMQGPLLPPSGPAAADPNATPVETTVETAVDAPAEPPARQPVSDSSRWNQWDAQVTPANYNPATTNPWGFHDRFLPKRVEANSGLRPGDIHVDAVARYLYHIQPDGTALRFGVAIAKGNLYEPGVYTIKVKKKWPTWRPTEDMIERDPGAYEKFADGMDGGPSNPLGSRALYLFSGGRDTYLRIHGTPYPRSIGGRASSGCVRMVMAHIIGLYDQVALGSSAHLYPAEGMLAARS